MNGDVTKIKIQSGSTVFCQECAVTGRKVKHKQTGFEMEIAGIRAGFGPKDRNAWVLLYPGSNVYIAATRHEFTIK